MRFKDLDRVKKEFCDQGYSIVEDAFELERVDRLEAAARRVWAMVRSGEVDVSGMGPETTSIFGTIAPEYGEPIFAECLIHGALTRYVEAFVGTELRLGHTHLWVADKGYDTGWHRDIGGEERDGTYEQEMEVLNRPIKGLHWQLALVDDPCLWLVPGSQKRYRSDEERHALVVDKKVELSGQKNIALKRGQTLFWNGNTIHRGRQPEGLKERISLTGALHIHSDDHPTMDVDERFRWRLADNVRDALPNKVKTYYDRWRSLQKA